MLIYTKGKHSDNADATIVVATSEPFNDVIAGLADFEGQVEAGKITVKGDQAKMTDLLAMQDNFNPMFPIVTP